VPTIGYGRPFLSTLRQQQRRHQLRLQPLRHGKMPVPGLYEDFHALSQEPRPLGGQAGCYRTRPGRTHLPTGHRSGIARASPAGSRSAVTRSAVTPYARCVKKGTARREPTPGAPSCAPRRPNREGRDLRAPLAVLVAVAGGLAKAVSRKLRQGLGLAFGPRERATLALCWWDVPQDYPNKPVVTDGLPLYPDFFSAQQHRASVKGSGQTSIAQGVSTPSGVSATPRGHPVWCAVPGG
jgi:hypothetical protein